QLADVEVRLNARLDETGFGMRLQQVTAHASPADVAIRTLQGALQIQGGVVQIDDLHIQTDQTTIIVNGALPGGAQATRLTLQMQPLDLTEAGHLVNNPTLRGQVQLALQAEGPREALQVHSEINTAGGRMAVEGLINMAATPLSYRTRLNIT